MADDTNLIIVPANSYLIKAAAALCKPQYSWMYLGSNIRFDYSIRKILSKDARRIHIADDLWNNSKKYRDDYVQSIGKIMPKSEDKFWWVSRISEKNLNVTNIFLYFCFIKSCLAHINQKDKQVLIICETRGLAKALLENLTSQGFKVKYIDNSLLSLANRLTLVFAGYCRLLWFFLQYSVRSLLARIFSMATGRRHVFEKLPKSWIVLHMWTDSRSFVKPGSCTDAYFGDLGDRLEKKGVDLCYLIDVLPTYSYIKSLKRLYSINRICIYLEQFITPVDVLKATVFFHVPSIRTHNFRIAEVFLGPVLDEELQRSYYDIRSRQALLCYYASIRLNKKPAIKRFIYTFENHIWEKMFCLGFRERKSHVDLVGYVHSAATLLYTSYSLSKTEKDIAPLPDKIITNGKRAADVLKTTGFNPGMIFIGGALRFPHLNFGDNSLNCDRDKQAERKRIVVVVSAGIDEALEIIHSSIFALADLTQFNVVLKFHPTTPFSQLKKYIPALPENFEISEKPMDDLLKDAYLCIYTSSAAAIEAYAMNIPLLHVVSEYRIDLDMCESFNDVVSAFSIEDIKKNVLNLNSAKNIISPDRKEKVEEIFSPPDEASYDLFLK